MYEHAHGTHHSGLCLGGPYAGQWKTASGDGFCAYASVGPVLPPSPAHAALPDCASVTAWKHEYRWMEFPLGLGREGDGRYAGVWLDLQLAERARSKSLLAVVVIELLKGYHPETEA